MWEKLRISFPISSINEARISYIIVCITKSPSRGGPDYSSVSYSPRQSQARPNGSMHIHRKGLVPERVVLEWPGNPWLLLELFHKGEPLICFGNIVRLRFPCPQESTKDSIDFLFQITIMLAPIGSEPQQNRDDS